MRFGVLVVSWVNELSQKCTKVLQNLLDFCKKSWGINLRNKAQEYIRPGWLLLLFFFYRTQHLLEEICVQGWFKFSEFSKRKRKQSTSTFSMVKSSPSYNSHGFPQAPGVSVCWHIFTCLQMKLQLQYIFVCKRVLLAAHTESKNKQLAFFVVFF